MKRSFIKTAAALISAALIICAMPAGAFADTQDSGSKQTKLIALTFDDGPCKDTERLLDGLKARGAKATFFMVGYNVAKYPSIVKRVYEEGHEVASHTYDHADLRKLSDEEIKSQVDRARWAINDSIGAYNDLILRPPYGGYDQRVLDALGTPAIRWSIDPADWKHTNNASAVVYNITHYARDGGIILVHDIHSWSVTAALQAVDTLKAQGYEFVTVSELFRRRGAQLSAGSIYNSCPPTGTQLPAVGRPQFALRVEGSQCYFTISAEPGTKIYYTTDGSVPNGASSLYTGPVPFEGEISLTAVAGYNMNGSRSDAATWHYDTSWLWHSENGHVYSDVFPSKWFFEAVDRAVGLGILDVGEDGRVEPGKMLTRGEVAVMLHRAAGRPQAGASVSAGAGGAGAAAAFSDVAADAACFEAVSWAAAAGIAAGYSDGSFRPDALVSRQELAAFVQRYCEAWLGEGGQADEGQQASEDAAVLESFSDYKDISEYAKAPLTWAVQKGLIKGAGEGVMLPRGTATRAQLAEILMRLAKPASDEAEAEGL